jgi:hypothetical protein
MSKPNLIHVVKSVLAAFIGVQSEANRIKDFQHGSFPTYVIVGIIFTLLFIFALVKVVGLVLST